VIAYLAKSSVNPMFAAEVLGERNRTQYIDQSRRTVAGRVAELSPAPPIPHTAAPLCRAGGDFFDATDDREPDLPAPSWPIPTLTEF